MDKKRLAEWLNEQMTRRNWSNSETAKAADVSHPTIGAIAAGTGNPNKETLLKLARAFGVPEMEVLRVAGILPEISAEDEETAKLYSEVDRLKTDTGRQLADIAIRMILEFENRQEEKQVKKNTQILPVI